MNDMNKRTFLSLLLCVCSLSFLHAERVDMQQAGADIQGRKLNTALYIGTGLLHIHTLGMQKILPSREKELWMDRVRHGGLNFSVYW